VNRQHPLPIFGGPEQPRPGIEELDDLGAGLDLGVQVSDDHLGQSGLQPAQHLGCGVHHALHGAEVLGALPFYEISGERERSAREAEHGYARSLELGAQRADDFEYERRRFPGIRNAKLFDLAERANWLIDDGSGPKVDRHAHRGYRREDVGKEDHRFATDQLNRLQRHLDRALDIPTHIEKGHPLTHLAVLGQVAAGLPHQPDRRAIDRLSAAAPQQSLGRIEFVDGGPNGCCRASHRPNPLIKSSLSPGSRG